MSEQKERIGIEITAVDANAIKTFSSVGSGAIAAQKNVDLLNTSIDSLSRTLSKTSSLFSAFDSHLSSMSSSTSKLESEFNKVSNATRDMESAFRTSRDSINETGRSFSTFGKNISSVNTSFADVSKKLGEGKSVIDQVGKSFNDIDVEGFSNKLAAISDSSDTAGEGLRKLKTDTSGLNDEFGKLSPKAIRAEADIKKVGESSKSTGVSVSGLVKRLAVLFAVSKMTSFADQWTAAKGKVNAFSDSISQTNLIMDKLYGVAIKTRQSFADMSQVYVRASMASKDLGMSQQEVLGLTESISKALAVQGTTSKQAQGALLQLGQALGSPRIMAEEYNSLLENTPFLLQIVAKNLAKTRSDMDGTVSGLTRIIKDRKNIVSNTEFAKAITDGTAEIDEAFKKTIPTFNQVGQNVNTFFIKLFGELNTSIGLTKMMNDVFVNLATVNFDKTVVAIKTIGVMIGTAFVTGNIVSWGKAVVTALNLVNAHPIVAIGTAIAGLIMYLSTLKEKTVEVNGEMVSWQAVVGGVGSYITETMSTAFDNVVGFAKDVSENGFPQISETWDSVITNMQKSDEKWKQSLGGVLSTLTTQVKDFFSDFDGTATGVVKKVVEIIGLAVSTIYAGTATIVDTVKNVVYSTINGIIYLLNGAISAWGGFLKFIGVGFDATSTKIESVVNKSVTYQLGSAGAAFGHFQKEAFDVVTAVTDAVEKGRGTVDKLTADISGKIITAQIEIDVNEKGIKDLEEALNNKPDKPKPVAGAGAKGGKGGQMRDTYTYEDANREMEKELKLLKMITTEREVYTKMYEYQEKFIRSNTKLTIEQNAALEEKIRLLIKEQAITNLSDAMLASTVEKRTEWVNTMEALKRLSSDETSGFTEMDVLAVVDQQMGELFENTQQWLDLRVDQYREMYEKIDDLRRNDFINEETAAQMKGKVDAQVMELRLQNWSTFFGDMASLSDHGNKKIARIGKAMAIVQATIDGTVAIQRALASASYPMNLVMAAAVGVKSAANIAKIASTGFATGGSFKVTGRGGADSQLVPLRLTPREEVTISTPAQVRKGDRINRGKDLQDGRQNRYNTTPVIINSFTGNHIAEQLESGHSDKALMNRVRQNSGMLTVL